MRLYCDNKASIKIAYNPIQHDRTKHVEIHKHFIKEKLENDQICMPYVSLEKKHLANIFTKSLPRQQFQELVSKLRMINIYNLA